MQGADAQDHAGRACKIDHTLLDLFIILSLHYYLYYPR